MSRIFRYRKCAAGFGGLAANLEADAVVSGSRPSYGLQIYKAVHLSLPREGVNWKDAAWLAFSLSLHAPALSSEHPGGLTIQIVSLTFPLSDYQSEVAALAMDGWLREEFGLADLGVSAVFDQSAGKYVFQWGEIQSPFSDDTATG
ncbi:MULTISPECIES: hypothetical protein [Streptomyces]|uniref:hypothetical protein n=1 Tax=Streptomyces TaxID=1883 RepID=UPI00163C7A9F|nr:MULTISPECIES: hypothetical protein [Streptomyces]MBC2874224.1 hypothetical protein [Streptomyces sp. TYQ1024]UBI40264.1 hypothetical protein K7I03_29975 [Streptomyces mobaraensis]UKW32842.1 hypothetical protein MCU78_29900 [Streptomyces sp. TYQ1024]